MTTNIQYESTILTLCGNFWVRQNEQKYCKKFDFSTTVPFLYLFDNFTIFAPKIICGFFQDKFRI